MSEIKEQLAMLVAMGPYFSYEVFTQVVPDIHDRKRMTYHKWVRESTSRKVPRAERYYVPPAGIRRINLQEGPI
jgi:hypothetical protein